MEVCDDALASVSTHGLGIRQGVADSPLLPNRKVVKRLALRPGRRVPLLHLDRFHRRDAVVGIGKSLRRVPVEVDSLDALTVRLCNMYRRKSPSAT